MHSYRCIFPVFVLGLAPLACVSSTDEPSEDEVIERLAGCPETDFGASPFAGPAFDPDTGVLLEPLPTPHVVATTVGWPVPDAPGLEEFGTRIEEITMNIFTRDGFLGVSLGGSDVCGSARTLSIWRDEAALMEFVYTPPHGDSFGLVRPDLIQGWETMHWVETESSAPPSWVAAKAHLTEERTRE